MTEGKNCRRRRQRRRVAAARRRGTSEKEAISSMTMLQRVSMRAVQVMPSKTSYQAGAIAMSRKRRRLPWRRALAFQEVKLRTLTCLPRATLEQRRGSLRATSWETSWSRIMAKTGNMVKRVAQPRARVELKRGRLTKQKEQENSRNRTEISTPRQTMNCASRHVDLQLVRPCHSISRTRCWNSPSEMSDDSAASLPSFPRIPTPTSLAWIIATSLPPSPIARQRKNPLPWPRRCSFIPCTTLAFCRGLTLQQATATASSVHLKNIPVSMAQLRELPSRTRTSLSAMVAYSLSCAAIGASDFMRQNPACLGLSPDEMQMQIAVSTLSPVNIHTFTPAEPRLSRLASILSCSRSSTPDTPSNSRCRSTSQATSVTSLSSSCSLARASRLAQSWYSSNGSYRQAKTSVRSPSRERLSHSSSTKPRT